MIFHSSQKQVAYPSLKLNHVVIDRVQSFNFLGVILDSTLKWNTHTNNTSLKISRVIGLMYRLKHIYPQAVLLLLYNALILPHFSYCLLAWGCKVTNDHPLHLLQKKALRIITNSDYVAHSEPICKQLRLIRVPDMYRFALWRFYFKLMNKTLPIYFNFMIPSLPIICEHYDIRRPSFHLPIIRHGYAEQLLEYQIISILNVSGSIIYTSKIQTHSFEGFKHFMKNNMINSYIDQCQELNCESCRMVNER